MILLAGDDFSQLLLDRRLSRARVRLKLLVFLLPEHFPVNQVLAHGSGVSDPFRLCSQLSLKGSDFWRLDWMLAESW